MDDEAVTVVGPAYNTVATVSTRPGRGIRVSVALIGAVPAVAVMYGIRHVADGGSAPGKG